MTPVTTPAEDGIATLRATAKWLVAAFAAVGAVLVAGVQLTELGRARPMWLAIGGFAIAIAAVAAAIWAASDVLRPRSLTPGQLSSSEDAKELRDAIDDDDTLLEGGADDLAGLVRALVAARADADAAWNAEDADVAEHSARVKALLAEDRRETLQDVVDRLADFGLYLAIVRAFIRARAVIVLSAIVCAAGAAAFSYATSRPAAVEAPRSPRLVSVRLTSDGIRTMRRALGARCDAGAIAAVQISGTLREPEVITLPQRHCAAQRFVVTREIGIATVG